MPATTNAFEPVRPRDRAAALAFVVIVQLVLGFALLRGLRLDLAKPADVVQRLIEIGVKPPSPVVKIDQHRPKRAEHQSAAAPKAAPAPIGGSPGPVPAHAPPSVTPIVPVAPTAAPSGGGTGTGPAAGSGAGGGTGGQGYGGDDGGGADLELISGEFRDSDIPKSLRSAGVSARLTATFTVQANGRPTGCHVTHSSGYAEMDAKACQLIERRFVFRPRLDRSGKAVAEEVDWDWEAGD
jgi:protein TonB